MPALARSQTVAGVDGCPGGWVVALWPADGGIALRSAADFVAVLALCANSVVIGVDMPIALPESGIRPSDSALRSHLGAAARSLFWTPTRPALAAETHADAVIANRAAGGKGPSIQGWGLRAKILEVRGTLNEQRTDSSPDRPTSCPKVREVHPESSFVTMAKLSGSDLPLASKKSGRGAGQRLALLAQHCAFDPVALTEVETGATVDDCLDAVAAAWTAARIANGTADWFGPNETDDEGFCVGVPT